MTRPSSYRYISVALAAAGLAGAALPALAQDYGDSGYGRYAPAYTAPYPGDEVAPVYNGAPYDSAPAHGGYAVEDLTVRAAPRGRARSSTTGAPIETRYERRAVSYHDLDLTTYWGQRELETRIRRAARSACRQLEAMYPIAAADNPPCVQDAVSDGLHQASYVIAGAQPRW